MRYAERFFLKASVSWVISLVLPLSASGESRPSYSRTSGGSRPVTVPPVASPGPEWPLAEARRKHIKYQVGAAELPVRYEVWKFGSPHTLVLTKTDELFLREARPRKDAAASVDWLPRNAVRSPHDVIGGLAADTRSAARRFARSASLHGVSIDRASSA